MSAIAALKGFRRQFLYSLHYMLFNQNQPYSYKLEGEEDLDVLDVQGNTVYAIQVKSLGKTLTLSDLVSHNKTSFLKRFVSVYPTSTPVLASFGAVSEDLKKWKQNPNHKEGKEQAQFLKAGISEKQIPLIKRNLLINEISEEVIIEEILNMLKTHESIDPVPTAENLLYYIQVTAEKQQLITAKDLLDMIIRMGSYLSERIAYTNQYGIYISPLTKTQFSETETAKLKEEFYYGISARYSHINAGLDVPRDHFLKAIDEGLVKYNVLVISGASGQGKSTLAYRYAFNKAAGSLIYEVSLQTDPATTNEAILAISTLTKGLKVPAYFIMHVTPNTTSWIQIAREFANHKYLRLLITIRKEDLFLAKTKELDFLYTEVELELAEEEARTIFLRLEDKLIIKTHNDFKDAWISLRRGVPLLEFIHAITQGSSLKDKLEAQVVRLTKEEVERSTGQLKLLRTLCLADAYGARIDVKLIQDIPNIKLIIDKFEKEYLLKHSIDGKYLSGLHPIRSMLLVDVLFDEFVTCKKDEIASCLKIIEQEDIYSFLLNVLYQRIIDPQELITYLKISGRNNWCIYGGAAKSLLWVGIRDYIDKNISPINEVQAKFGDAWNIVIDVYHGDIVDLEGIQGMMTENNPELLDFIRKIQQKISPKSDVYLPIIQLFCQIPLPETPSSISEWRNFAETLFWLGQTENKARNLDDIKEESFRTAFHLLDVQTLSLLMLGMHYYSTELNRKRLELSQIFNEKLREEFLIPFLEIKDEVRFDFLIDITKEDQHTGWHDMTIRIIDLLRTAYPEKTVYRSQGHGHRIDILQSYHDETTKNIPAKSLPLPTWVNLNSNTIALIDYPGRPNDWMDFHQRLAVWESEIKGILTTFSRSFVNFRKVNKFDVLSAVANQSSYQSLSRLAAPKSMVDPLGLPVKTKGKTTKEQKDERDIKEVFFANKYDAFIKSYNDYKSTIENFIRQSGQSCFEGVKKVVDGAQIDEHILHLTYVNLYDAAEKRIRFQTQREKYFKKFSDKNIGVSDAELFQTATIWRSFWIAINANDPSRIQLTESITSLKNDFVKKLTKAIKKVNDNSNLKIIYRNDAATGFLPVFINQVSDPLHSILGMKECYNLFAECVVGTDYENLKYMMLQRYFSKVYIINEINGNSFDIKWHEFPLYLLMDTPFEKLPSYRFMANEIDEEIAANLKLKSWVSIHPEGKMIQKLAMDFERLKLYLGHLADLKFFNEKDKFDDTGDTIIITHFEKVGSLTTETWNDVLESLTDLAKEFNENAVPNVSEEEREYLTILMELLNGMVTEEAELSPIFFDIDSLADWSGRLKALNERWGLFILLLQKKVLVGFDKPQKPLVFDE